MGSPESNSADLKVFESEAEVIAAYQLDLLAQMEGQLRAMHRMLRGIERLRTAGRRAGPGLTDAGLSTDAGLGITLTTLAAGISMVDEELQRRRINRRESASLGRSPSAILISCRANFLN